MRKQTIMLVFFLFISGCSDTKPAVPITTNEFLVIAHRGASTYAPEHTMLAYEIAQQSEATYIEIDLQMTKDGILVAMHDETIDRTTEGTGLVKDYTLEEIKQLDAGQWFNSTYPNFANESYEGLEVPTLEEIFSRFGDEVNYYIEMKSPKIYEEMEEELIALLQKYDLIHKDEKLPKVIIQSFNRASLTEFHELEPRLPLIQLFSFKEQTILSGQDYNSLSTYASGIGVNLSAVDKTFIHEVQEKGFQIHLYSINDELDMKKAIDFKANGAFTNTPNLAIDLLNQSKD